MNVKSTMGTASMSNASLDNSRLYGVMANRVALLLLSTFLVACNGVGPWQTPVARVSSPDGSHVAELIEEDSGATGGVWTTVRLGAARSHAKVVVYSIQGVADNTVVRWNGSSELIITDPKLATAKGPRKIVASYDGISIRAIQPTK
jgi:hypothetical protein